MKTSIAKPSSRTLFGVGVAALLLALAGTGGAVAGSVVTGKQIKNSTVTTADIKNKTLTTADLAPAAVTALTGKAGPAGAAGPAGPAGVAGPAGAAGATGANGLTNIAVRQKFFEPTGAGGTVQAFCAADERAVTAAFQTDGQDGGIPVITESFPVRADGQPVTDTIAQGSGWQAELVNISDVEDSGVLGSISVVCAKDAS